MMPGAPLNKSNIVNSQSTYNATYTSIRVHKSTRRRMKAKRIPPESYDDLLNRIFDEYPDGVTIVELIHRVEELEKKARK